MSNKYFEKANIELKRGQYKKAIKTYAKAIESNPQMVSAYYNSGLAAQNLGRKRLASDYFHIATQLKSNSTIIATHPERINEIVLNSNFVI